MSQRVKFTPEIAEFIRTQFNAIENAQGDIVFSTDAQFIATSNENIFDVCFFGAGKNMKTGMQVLQSTPLTYKEAFSRKKS